jgi:uncharacterized membrane protein
MKKKIIYILIFMILAFLFGKFSSKKDISQLQNNLKITNDKLADIEKRNENLIQQLKENNQSLLQSTNISLVITTSHTERYEGIKSFISFYKTQHKDQLDNTIIISIEELDDSESICCYKQETQQCYQRNDYN